MVSALDSGSRGPGSSPGRGIVLCCVVLCCVVLCCVVLCCVVLCCVVLCCVIKPLYSHIASLHPGV